MIVNPLGGDAYGMLNAVICYPAAESIETAISNHHAVFGVGPFSFKHNAIGKNKSKNKKDARIYFFKIHANSRSP